jgi:hypothetical protein
MMQSTAAALMRNSDGSWWRAVHGGGVGANQRWRFGGVENGNDAVQHGQGFAFCLLFFVFVCLCA